MDHTFTFRPSEENSGYLLWQASMLWQLKMKKCLDPLNLTFTQFTLLAALQWLQTDTNVTQKDLASHIKLDKMTTSKVLRTLQTKGFIARGGHEGDARAKSVKLTPSGLKLLQKAVVAVHEADELFFSALGEAERDFQGMLRRLLEPGP